MSLSLNTWVRIRYIVEVLVVLFFNTTPLPLLLTPSPLTSSNSVYATPVSNIGKQSKEFLGARCW